MVSEVDSDSDEEISTNRNKENSQRASIVWRLPSGEDNFKGGHKLDFSFLGGIVTYLSLVPNFATAEDANFVRLWFRDLAGKTWLKKIGKTLAELFSLIVVKVRTQVSLNNAVV